jgi:ATP-dependent Clp protease ATP-binding subunit ClpC
MEIKFSPELLCILNYARDEAMRTGSYGIGADHIMLALLRHADNNACRALAACGIASDGLKEAIDRKIFSERAVPWQDRAMVRPTRAAAAQLSAAAYEALKYGQHEILSSHFLLALVRSASGAAADLLRSRGLEYGRLRDLMHEHRFILPRRQDALPRMEDLLGPLGEQLTRLYGQAGDDTRFLS